MEKSKVNLITVLGHTAAGKTAFAARLARKIRGEIISADSRQVYRGMDIGTGKDYEDYLVDGVKVRTHLIDILEAGFEYNVYLFKQDFQRVYTDILDRHMMPVLCGGSGLYIESVLRNYNLLQVPTNQTLRKDLQSKNLQELQVILKRYGPLHNVTDSANRNRIIRAIEIAMFQASNEDRMMQDQQLNPLVIGIKYDRAVRRNRITERLRQRLENGLVEEVEGLLQQGVTSEKMDYYGLEYRFVTRYILNEYTFDEMFKGLNTAIHQFAKRQMTYFRGMERRGVAIHWLEGQLSEEDKLEVSLRLFQDSHQTEGRSI